MSDKFGNRLSVLSQEQLSFLACFPSPRFHLKEICKGSPSLSVPVPCMCSLSGAASLWPCPWNCWSSPKGNILKKNETETKQGEGEEKRRGRD